MNFEMLDSKTNGTIIKVVGVGGAGGNAAMRRSLWSKGAWASRRHSQLSALDERIHMRTLVVVSSLALPQTLLPQSDAIFRLTLPCSLDQARKPVVLAGLQVLRSGFESVYRSSPTCQSSCKL